MFPDEPPSTARQAGGSRARLAILVGLVALVAAGLWAWRQYRSPERAWLRAIRGPERAKAWSTLVKERTIDGLDRDATIRQVFDLVADPDPETRREAVAAVPWVDAPPIDAIPLLAARLGDADLQVKVRAASSLGEVVRRGGPGHDEAVAALAVALKDPEAAVRKAAVDGLGRVVYEGGNATDPLRSGRADDPALGLVADRLSDADPSVRIEAAYVLACNDRGDEAVPMLAAYVRDQPKLGPFDYLADRAFLAIMVLAVRSDQAAAFLAGEVAVKREDYPDRPRDALAWAARQSTDAKVRIKRLATAGLRDLDPTVKHNAAILLHEIGSGISALPGLIEALADPSAQIRVRAVEALADLASLDDPDPTIVPALQKASADANAEVREHARGALEEIEWAEIMHLTDPVLR